MSVKLVYSDVAVGAADAAEVESSAAVPGSDASLLPAGIDPTPLATGELNAWGLNGIYQIKDNQPIGFWSATRSLATGLLSPTPTITVTFPNQYTSLGVYLRFDDSTGDYCPRVRITWYNGTTQLSQKLFQPTGPRYFCENTVETYNKIVIELMATSLPYRYARVSQIIFGVIREFDISELRSVSIQQESDPISSELAISTMDWTLDSQEAIDYIFQQKQPVEAYDGSNLIGVYYIDTSKRKSTSLYDISCTDAIGVLDDGDFAGGMYSGKNAKALILEVLNDDFALEMDTDLESATITGYLPASSRREALQQIAFAIGGIVSTARTGAVKVKALPSSDAAVIPTSRTYTGGDVETDAIVTAVKVTAHTYTQGSGSSGDDVIEINGTKYVHTTSVVTINNPSVTASDKPNVLEVKEATLINTSNAQAVAQRIYNNALRRETHNVKIVMDQEQPGDYVTTTTPYGSAITGNITSMSITLSGIATAEAKIKGA